VQSLVRGTFVVPLAAHAASGSSRRMPRDGAEQSRQMTGLSISALPVEAARKAVVPFGHHAALRAISSDAGLRPLEAYSRLSGRSRSGLRGIGGHALGSSGVPQFSGSRRDDAMDRMSERADGDEAG